MTHDERDDCDDSDVGLAEELVVGGIAEVADSFEVEGQVQGDHNDLEHVAGISIFFMTDLRIVTLQLISDLKLLTIF